MFIQITFCFTLSFKSPPKYYHLHHIHTFNLTFSKRFDIKPVFPVIWFSFPLMLHSASERGDRFLISDLKRNSLQKCKENSDSLDLIYHIKFKYQNKNKYKKWGKKQKTWKWISTVAKSNNTHYWRHKFVVFIHPCKTKIGNFYLPISSY